MATALTSLCIVCDTVISHSRRMGSGLSGHPFADYRGRRSKDSAPIDAQDRRDERPRTGRGPPENGQSGAAGLDDLELADFPVTGRGARTLRRFKQGERILTIPGDSLWTVEHAYADPILGPVLRSTQPPLSVEDTLAVYLLFVRSRESGYEGPRSHVAALPARYSSSIFFAEDELEVCAGTSLYTITKQVNQRIKDDYRGLLMRVLGLHPDLFPLDQFTIEDYKWALCTFWSRAMDFVLPNGKALRVLAPFADMLNHSPEVKQCHAYDPLSGNLSVLAGKDYEVGDQISIFYGSIPNNRLLRLYGFVISDNPNDSYDLVLSTHPMAPFFEQKQKLWASAGLNSTSTISLTLTNPLPKNILQYLRIQRLDESDLIAIALQKLNINKKISNSKEVEVLQRTASVEIGEKESRAFVSRGAEREGEGFVIATGAMRKLRKGFCAVNVVREV
ncbi:set-domain histone methyltransferase-9 [Trichoderma gamsii]|uniref:Set-domain histone methyltransferase-9 n=1 Tax=Trichoderma gamsii TaxID=398673 RepID=A0A2P4ZSN5_9HYPO|nr:set-domain histone methyltransferase-9 [Trichoderma gamsii]PON27281.1 set-domain histone methyltransferase-9 [Trichoderma gamsii]